MIGLTVGIIFVSLIVAYFFLQGVTHWHNKDIPKAFGYVAGGVFIMMYICVILVSKAVTDVIDDRIEKYGGDTIEESIDRGRVGKG